MSIVDGKGLITWEGGLFTPDSALLPRVRWAFAQIRADGGSISLNEAGRPVGVPSDQYARNSQDTESGRSTVWYQWGRKQRGETPEAADPHSGNVLASEHTQGIAIDCNAAQPALRAKYFAMVGLKNTIASESWHWAIRGPVQVDLSAYSLAGDNITPFPEEEDMPITEEEFARIRRESTQGVFDAFLNPSTVKQDHSLEYLLRLQMDEATTKNPATGPAGLIFKELMKLTPAASTNILGYRIDGDARQWGISIVDGYAEEYVGNERERLVNLGLLRPTRDNEFGERVVSRDDFLFLIEQVNRTRFKKGLGPIEVFV